MQASKAEVSYQAHLTWLLLRLTTSPEVVDSVFDDGGFLALLYLIKENLKLDEAVNVLMQLACNLVVPGAAPSSSSAASQSDNLTDEAVPGPDCWLDVVEPLVLFLHECLQRFQDVNSGAVRSVAGSWLGTLQTLINDRVNQVAPSELLGGRWRRCMDVVRKLAG